MTDLRPRTPNGPHLSLRTTEPTAFGSGWVSGVLAGGGIERLLTISGIAPHGVLSLPVGWRLQ